MLHPRTEACEPFPALHIPGRDRGVLKNIGYGNVFHTFLRGVCHLNRGSLLIGLSDIVFDTEACCSVQCLQKWGICIFCSGYLALRCPNQIYFILRKELTHPKVSYKRKKGNERMKPMNTLICHIYHHDSEMLDADVNGGSHIRGTATQQPELHSPGQENAVTSREWSTYGLAGSGCVPMGPCMG